MGVPHGSSMFMGSSLTKTIQLLGSPMTMETPKYPSHLPNHHPEASAKQAFHPRRLATTGPAARANKPPMEPPVSAREDAVDRSRALANSFGPS